MAAAAAAATQLRKKKRRTRWCCRSGDEKRNTNQNEGGEAALLDQTSNNGGAKDDEGTETGSLRRQSSTEDMFALYCEKHVELVANALGNDAKCMLYLTEERSGGGLRLAQVASFPWTTSYEGADEEDNNINDNDNNPNNSGHSMNRGGRPSSSNRGQFHKQLV